MQPVADGGASQSRWADRTFLRSDQYRTEDNLRARQSIYAYQQPRIDLPRAVLDITATEHGDAIVDVGCGNGRYLAELGRRDHRGPLIGVDISRGMLEVTRKTTPPARFVVASASTLPLRDDSADLVLSTHMLYHLPDPALAVREFRRVLKPGGRLAVVLNAQDHLQELRESLAKANEQLGIPGPGFGERLSLRHGEELLRTVFGAVARHDFVSQLVLTDLDPVEAYVRSSISASSVPKTRQDEYVRLVLSHMPQDAGGQFSIRAHPGCLVCR